MAQATVIADATALICLGWIDQLSILPGLFGRIVIPPAVAAEATQRGTGLPNWIDVRPLGRAIDVRVAAARLDAGEREVLSLGLAKRRDEYVHHEPLWPPLRATGTPFL